MWVKVSSWSVGLLAQIGCHDSVSWLLVSWGYMWLTITSVIVMCTNNGFNEERLDSLKNCYLNPRHCYYYSLIFILHTVCTTYGDKMSGDMKDVVVWMGKMSMKDRRVTFFFLTHFNTERVKIDELLFLPFVFGWQAVGSLHWKLALDPLRISVRPSRTNCSFC